MTTISKFGRITMEINDPADTRALADVAIGWYCVDSDGHLYYRTQTTGTCLTDAGKSFSTDIDHCKHRVRVLRPGTTITLTITY